MLWLVFAATLAAIAYLSPEPDRVTDRRMYEATAQQYVIPDCGDLHCFRVLMPWVLGSVPGPSLPKWKSYAVLANATAAIVVLALSLAWALPARAAVMAATLSAFGFGALYTLHDVFTSDPLMFALGPALVLLLLRERFAIAAAMASVGVLAKEFAAAPLYVFYAASMLQRRLPTAWRSLAAANCALIVWLLLQFTLMLRFNYGYGDNPSTHLGSGGYLAKWLSEQSARGAVIARSASTARSARNSWKKPTRALMMTMAPTAMASSCSPRNEATAAAPSNRPTTGLLNWDSKSERPDVVFSRST